MGELPQDAEKPLQLVIPIPQSRERNLALETDDLGDSSLRSLESHVIPAKAGIQMDPRLRGGDQGLTFISMGGPQAHDHSE
jgi:hypothetical protein